MIFRIPIPLLLMASVLSGSLNGSGRIVVSEWEEDYGPLQGKMEKGDQTVLLFEQVKVRVCHDSGETEIEKTQPASQVDTAAKAREAPDLRMIKRRIARLPAYEQVRYWKLHQIRYPVQDVSNELHAALDLMETIRERSLEDPAGKPEEADSGVRYPRRDRRYAPYNSGYGYGSYHRYRRARYKDGEYEHVHRRERRPVEEWTTAMSLADRARSDAYSKISGARSAPLNRVR